MGSVAARIFHLQTTHQEGESASQHQIKQATVNHTSNGLKVELTTRAPPW